MEACQALRARLAILKEVSERTFTFRARASGQGTLIFSSEL